MNVGEILAQLRSGEIPSTEEATRRLVADILRERIRMESKVLTARICEQLQTDPALRRALERLWLRPHAILASVGVDLAR